MSATIDLRTLPADATFLRVHGVNYVHCATHDGGELYLTEYGVPFCQHLMPENWYAAEWFKTHRQALVGTSTVYRVVTKPLENLKPTSIQLVVKWSRMGQDVPLRTHAPGRRIDAEFNSPFEEFSLLQELRHSIAGPPPVFTQKPLGIYVPGERMQLWQSGRSKYKVRLCVSRHPGIEIDILRSYILLYGWIEGTDAVTAYAATHYSSIQTVRGLQVLTEHVHAELNRHGFTVADHKPTHIIVRIENGQVKKRRDGSVMCAIVDYELLSRTEARTQALLAEARRVYLVRQRDRFIAKPDIAFPRHLRPCSVLGTDYIVGRCESTGGMLWVVGRDPELFNYFLPEQWHIKQVHLSDTGRTFYAKTRDGVHVVWKISRIGEIPPGDDTEPANAARLEYGYNSPFEEVSIAIEMQRAGVPVTYPRAIYTSGAAGEDRGGVLDERRFVAMKNERSPFGQSVLPLDRDYVVLWGYFRGWDDADAVQDDMFWTPIDAQQAVVKGLIPPEDLPIILSRHALMLSAAGFVDLNAKPDHVLLCYVPAGPIKRDALGFPATRQCNFEFVRRISICPRVDSMRG